MFSIPYFNFNLIFQLKSFENQNDFISDNKWTERSLTVLVGNI